MGLTKHKLGGFIELIDNRNSDLAYGPDDVRGVNNLKKLMPTKADISGRDLGKFQIVKPDEFVFNHRTSRNGEKFSIAYNDGDKPIICTEDYVVFRIKPECKKTLSSDWIYMFFNRPEFDRYVITNSWGSSTEFFNWSDICEVQIFLPTLSIQEKYVAVYKSMLANQQSYERGLEDLKFACNATIEDLRKKYPHEEMGKYVASFDKRNSDGKCSNVKGVTVYKELIETKADLTDVSLDNYKFVTTGDIVYVPTTNRNGDRIACGIAKEDTIVSQIYQTITAKDKNVLDTRYLFLWFMRGEMDRYARYHSWGSARENITEEDLFSYLLPVPPIATQKCVADIFSVYTERKKLNEKLKVLIKDLCPILIKGSIEEARKEA